jgi:hypothetical protein
MVRRARSQNVPAEEFVDRGPGKSKCTGGVSQEGEPLLLSGNVTSCSTVCVGHLCGIRAAPRMVWKLSAKFGQEVRRFTWRGGIFCVV